MRDGERDMNIGFERRLAAAREELRSRGLTRRRREPLSYRTLWALGLEVRPPHYADPVALLLHDLLFWVAIYGTSVWLIGLPDSTRGFTFGAMLITATLISSAITGVRVAYYRHSARRHTLSRWESLR